MSKGEEKVENRVNDPIEEVTREMIIQTVLYLHFVGSSVVVDVVIFNARHLYLDCIYTLVSESTDVSSSTV